MGKSRQLTFKSLFKPRNPKLFPSSLISPSPWPWPSCKQPRTLSFRLPKEHNSDSLHSSDSFSTASSSVIERGNLSTASDCSVEAAAMRAVTSNRLFFDGPSDRSSSISCKEVVGVPFEGSVAVEMESEDLYRDFRVSMKEMVDARGDEKKDLGWFNDMLGWYLTMNKKWTHEFIIEAFWDLILEMMLMGSSCTATASSSSFSSSSTTSTSSSLSSYVSCLLEIEEVEEEKEEEEGDNKVFA